jgi:hypothetical protein
MISKKWLPPHVVNLLYNPKVPGKVGTLNLMYFLHILIRQLQHCSILLYALMYYSNFIQVSSSWEWQQVKYHDWTFTVDSCTEVTFRTYIAVRFKYWNEINFDIFHFYTLKFIRLILRNSLHLMPVLISISVFWNIIPNRLICRNEYFRGYGCLLFQSSLRNVCWNSLMMEIRVKLDFELQQVTIA